MAGKSEPQEKLNLTLGYILKKLNDSDPQVISLFALEKGYKSRRAITNWIYRNRIPANRELQVERLTRGT